MLTTPESGSIWYIVAHFRAWPAKNKKLPKLPFCHTLDDLLCSHRIDSLRSSWKDGEASGELFGSCHSGIRPQNRRMLYIYICIYIFYIQYTIVYTCVFLYIIYYIYICTIIYEYCKWLYMTYASKILQNRPKYSSHTFPTSSRFAASWVVCSPGNSSQTRLFKACISPGSFVQGFRCLKIIANNSLLASLVSTRFYNVENSSIWIKQSPPPRQHPSSPPDSHFAHSRVSNPSLFCRNSSWLLRVTAYLGGKLQWKTVPNAKLENLEASFLNLQDLSPFLPQLSPNSSKFLLQYCTYLTTSYLTRVYKYIHMVHMVHMPHFYSFACSKHFRCLHVFTFEFLAWKCHKKYTMVSTYQDLSANAVAV